MYVYLHTLADDTVVFLVGSEKTPQEYDASPLSICQIFRPKIKLPLNKCQMDRVKY